jgi:hypothetical protein
MVSLRSLLLSTFMALICFFALNQAAAQADVLAQADVTRTDPIIVEGQLSMDINFDLRLNTAMIQGVERGVPLYFTVDLEIVSPRWWWFDQVVITTTLTRRLTYNTLTQQWRVASGDFSLPVDSLESGLKMLSVVRAWPIAPTDRFEPNVRYQGRVRLRLDTTHLVRSLQLDAMNRGVWSLSSSWAPFDFSIRRPNEKKP